MKIIVVDDEELAVLNMLSLLKKIEPDAKAIGFNEVNEAFDYLSQNTVDIAFLDVELGEYNGVDLAVKCKELCPHINIIFVTGYSQYMMDAFKIHASGYLMKPVRATDLRAEIDNVRHPIVDLTKKRMRIQTFGHFEVFVDNQLLKFTRTKCKECLAYLVDRKGARVTYPDLSAILWEDRPYDRKLQNNTQRVISDLMKTLKAVNMQDLIIKSRQDIAIETTLVECDYYELLNGNLKLGGIFTGEYMSNYSWGEYTLGELTKSWKE